MSDPEYKVLDAVEQYPTASQRQLAQMAEISLGQVNYVLKSLVAKGLLKINNFSRAANKAKYAYILTPQGIEEKSKLTANFVKRKLKEYQKIKDKITVNLQNLDLDDNTRMLFIGPFEMHTLLLDAMKPLPLQNVKVHSFPELPGIPQKQLDEADIILLFSEAYFKQTLNNEQRPKVRYLW